jgi:predicted O-linked N-acetylglucosamine transferase (SPINDLY family)
MTLENLLNCAWRSFEKNDFAGAESLACSVLEEDKVHSSAHHLLGLIEIQRREKDGAIEHFSLAVEKEKNNPQLYYNYAHVLQSCEKYSKAKKYFKLAIELKPDYYSALNNLGALHHRLGELKKAENVLKRATSINDTRPHAYCNLGNLYKSEARISEAKKFYARALQCDPGFSPAASNAVFSLCYDPKLSATEIFQGHLKYEKCLRAITGDAVFHSNRDLQKRPLKIGYVSPDFRNHSIAYFSEPILALHDRTRFEVFCYSNVANPDGITSRFQRYDVNWRNIFGVGYEKVVKQIMNDEIDMLVDLSGHSGNNCLKVFMKKPAPVQISYLGYPFSTGLTTMDFKLVDEITDLPGQERYYSEELYRLEGCFLAYYPPKGTPEPSPPPCLQNGFVTYGSFNSYSKLNDHVINLWAELLVSVPNSRIVIKAKPVKDENVKKRLLEKFNAQGVDSDRVELLYHSASTKEHLECYREIDIALDPFPYNGTTTICEALWMGVPVVALIGQHHISRVTYSILKNAGLEILAASDQDKYLELAGFLASDTDQLESLRAKLRMALVNSPICKYDDFVRKIESAYLFMWRSLFDNE